MKFESTINKRGAVPANNPIDKLLYRANKACLIEDVRYHYDKDYWNYFVKLMSLEEITYVLKFQQEGNWNYVLYEECQKEYSRIFNEELEKVLF